MTVEQRKRARKVINRGGRNYRILVPSAKNDTMIHCESQLEAAAANLFEKSKIVVRYSEQPIVVQYELNQQIREYYPDFLIWVEDTPIYVEIKPEKQIKTLPIKEKLYALKKHFIDRQVHFMVLSEVTIKAKNAEQLFALKADLLLMEADNNDAF